MGLLIPHKKGRVGELLFCEILIPVKNRRIRHLPSAAAEISLSA